MKVSDLLVQSLSAEGVECVFGIPGEETLDFLESLRRSNIRFILTRHEQAAGIMAATYGRLTGKAGVCLSTLGPGATNLVTAAAYAQLGAMPMLMITGQKPIKKSKQGRFQIVDVVNMMRPITKFTRQVVHGGQIPYLVCEAFRIAQEERPGAVHLELPEDIAGEETDASLIPPHTSRRPSPDPKTLDQAASLIAKARRPLLLIGAAANRNRTSRALHGFIDKTGIPFFNTQMGKGVVDERHPAFIGTAALSDSDFLHSALARADLILNVGHDVVEKPPFFMHPGKSQVIHINHFMSAIDAVYFPQLDVVGDVATSVQGLTQRVTPHPAWDFSIYNRAREYWKTHLNEHQQDTRFPVLPQYLVATVREVMPDNGVVVLDNGMYKIWFARNYLAYQPNTLLLDNALATMGAGLPSALAAKLVCPERPVLAVCGDGGFLMSGHELETAVRLKLDLTVLLVRDNGLGMIQWKQDALNLPRFGLDHGNPDFVRLAEAYGANGHRLDRAENLPDQLKQCLQTPGVHLVDVPVDYSENKRVLNQELPQLIAHFEAELAG